LPETILAFDYGLRRIGVAVGQDVTASASPVGIVENGEKGVDHDRIRAIISEWHPTRLVVGMPTHRRGRGIHRGTGAIRPADQHDR
jgi:putative Holliday junction resolvase